MYELWGDEQGRFLPEIQDWLNDRIHWSSFHHGGFGKMYFLEPEDAVEFKLRFCDV